jgi:hypothetical protein
MNLQEMARLAPLGRQVVPCGPEKAFPALARWAKLVRPFGAGFSGISSHQLA